MVISWGHILWPLDQVTPLCWASYASIRPSRGPRSDPVEWGRISLVCVPGQIAKKKLRRGTLFAMKLQSIYIWLSRGGRLMCQKNLNFVVYEPAPWSPVGRFWCSFLPFVESGWCQMWRPLLFRKPIDCPKIAKETFPRSLPIQKCIGSSI